jgi:iron complex outermembrane receptor protein
VQPFRLYGTETLPQLAGQRVAGQPQRRLELVDERQPHRQRRPAAHVRHPAGPAARPARAGTPVTGAALASTTAGQPWYILGSSTQYHTLQDHVKAKLAYDFTRHGARHVHAGLVAERGDGPVGQLPAQRGRRVP